MAGIVVAASLCAGGVADSRADEAAAPVAIDVNVAFDATITSRLVQDLARQEAAGIWDPYGVHLRWAACDDRSVLCLDATVGRFGASPEGTGHTVLAHTTINSERILPHAIRVSFDAIDAIVGEPTYETPPVREQLLGLAVGRVMAHEIGHVLLGAPGYHDRQGLMRAAFRSDELGRFDRIGFHLARASVDRLRERLALLTGR